MVLRAGLALCGTLVALAAFGHARALANAACSGARASQITATVAATGSTGLAVRDGMRIERIATVHRAREMVALPNGDLLVGTGGDVVEIVPHAENARDAGKPQVWATFPDEPANGVAFSPTTCTVYVATGHAMFAIPYRDGDLSARGARKIADVRAGDVAPNSDGDVHTTSSVAVGSNALFESVGSSCNACVEVDPTRATVQQMHLDGSAMTTRARRIRNAIALAIDPSSDHLWAGGAGQDGLAVNHPYEFFDDVTAHGGVVDYHWPDCEENRQAYTPGTDCSHAAVPLIVFPAYSTMIGAAFYPLHPTGHYALPARWHGAIFITQHGSWHTPGGCHVPPQVDAVPMNAGRPQKPANWANPRTQWLAFVTGFQPGCDASTRIARATGIAIGPKGSLFVSDDAGGAIYRIRP